MSVTLFVGLKVVAKILDHKFNNMELCKCVYKDAAKIKMLIYKPHSQQHGYVQACF